MKIYDINQETLEGQLLLTAIGDLMNYERTKTPDDILHHLEDILKHVESVKNKI